MPFNDLREFIEAARRLGQVKEIHGADWNLEIGALTELFGFKDPSPLVLFDRIPGYPAGFRVASNLINTPARSSLTVGMPPDAKAIELIAKWKELLKGVKPVPPRVVSSGPILENVKSGADIDMTLAIKAAGEPFNIVIHDHLIVSKGGTSSFKTMGLL